MNLRLATIHDFDDIYRMVKLHWDHGPYEGFNFSEEKVKSRVRHFIENQGDDFIVILGCDNEKPVAILAAFVVSPEFSDDRMAVEHIWWVDADYRNSRVGLDLVKAYEYWAKHRAKCVIAHLSLFEIDGKDRISKFYTRQKYSPTEQTFVKVL